MTVTACACRSRQDGAVIPLSLARALRDAGVRWTPAAGDAFAIADRDMDADVFYLADMTVEVHRLPSGPVIGFNGTTEWALDSIEASQTVWLPNERQLRELLGTAFRSLAGTDDGRFEAVVHLGGRDHAFRAEDADVAYAQALYFLVTGDRAQVAS